MKNQTLLVLLISFGICLVSCNKKGCMDPTALNYDMEAVKDNGTCMYATEGQITLQFSHNVNGSSLSSADFDQLNYTNLDGNTWSITKMQYLISDVRFYKANGDSVILEGYHLVDMDDSTTFNYILPDSVRSIPFVGIGFNYGFEEEDNLDGAYTDLNEASWSSPMMLGGGYHQMKFEGRYIDVNTDTIGFQYHNLSKTGEVSGPDTTWVPNYAWIKLPYSFDLDGNTTIEIKMDVNEWFQNPNTWDLDTYYTTLMPNFTAQKMMKANAYSVFSIGSVSAE